MALCGTVWRTFKSHYLSKNVALIRKAINVLLGFNSVARFLTLIIHNQALLKLYKTIGLSGRGLVLVLSYSEYLVDALTTKCFTVSLRFLFCCVPSMEPSSRKYVSISLNYIINVILLNAPKYRLLIEKIFSGNRNFM